jgi:F-type H+-transporting ATPase subunit b
MMQFGPTFIWVAVNLIVLFIVLRKILFKKITQVLESRTQTIKANLDDAEKAKLEANDLRRSYEEQIKTIKKEAETILDSARVRGDKEYEALISDAQRRVSDMMLRANEEIERERQQLMKDVKNQVATLALVAASKVIEANMDNESNRTLVNKFIDEAGAA